MQSSLFPEETTSSSSEVVLSKTASNISKAKTNFLKALEKNKKLKERRDFLKAILDDSLILIQKEMPIAEAQLANALLEELLHLDKAFNNRLFKFTKKRKEAFSDLIFDKAGVLLNEYNKTEANTYFDKYKPEHFDEMMGDMKEEVRDQFKTMFGVDIDPEDFMGDDIDMEKMFEKYGDTLEQMKNGGKRKSNRKQSKKQTEAEERRKADEKLLDADMQLLFRQLAIKLHPDKEPDEALKLEKEEMMKKVSAAREDQDIYELLRIRAMISESDTSLTQEVFNDDALLRLTKLVREKNKQIEMDLFSLQRNHYPLNLFYGISNNKNEVIAQIKGVINKQKQEMEEEAIDIRETNEQLNSNSFVNRYIDEYIEEQEIEDMFDDMGFDHNRYGF